MIRAFNILAKPIGPICNLNCQYCFYLGKETLYPEENNFKMSEGILEEFIRRYIKSQDVEPVHFIWQGGEPTLLGVKFFKKVADLQKKYSQGKKIENSFQTNGILLNDEWCEFFLKNEYLVGISIDGPQHLHDKYRINKKGQPTFDSVLKGIEFLKKHDVKYNTLTVVNRTNGSSPLEVYRFLKEIGQGFMQFIPVVERNPIDKQLEKNPVQPDNVSPNRVTEWSVRPAQYGNFLCEIFNEWVRNDVGTIFVQSFDVALESWVGMNPNLCIFSETCGKALAIEHNGDLYSCDHYVFPENRLGNIAHQQLDVLALSKQQNQFGQDKKDTLPNFCKNCQVKFACNGGCPKNRLTLTPDGESGLNYLCEGYQHFFMTIAPYMRFMANELKEHRPPANVMQWVKEKDMGFPNIKVERNDPCPCGSGIKFKRCCGM